MAVIPSDAEVFLDGRRLGPASALGGADGVLSLEPGVYQITVRKKGFETWRAEVAVGDRVERIEVSLVPGP